MPYPISTRRVLQLCLCVGWLLASCTYRGKPAPVATLPSAPTLEATAPGPTSTVAESMPLPSPTNEPGTSVRPTYTLTATLDYAAHRLSVEEQIDYINRTNATLDELALIVEANRYSGAFDLKTLSVNGSEVGRNYTLESNLLRLPLSSRLSPGQPIALTFIYELNLPAPIPSPMTRPAPFGVTPRQTNLVDWYPYIPPYDPAIGWLAHQPGYFGEHQVYENADFVVSLRIAGAPPQPAGNTQTPAMTIAASTAPQIDGEWYRYRFENARNFAWSASHDYVVTSRTVGEVTVTSYAFPVHAAAGEAALEATANALSLYSELFSPYPRRYLSVVEADFLDGMEYDGLYFLSNGFYNLYSGKPADYLVAIAAHETAHQWFYALVGNDQAQEPWLDEALCTYSERLYYERFAPDALDWWWAYRIRYYNPQGKIDGSIYSYTYTSEAYRAYRDAVYLNGALFFEDLRNQLGDQAFFAFLQDYVRRNSYALSNGDAFFSALEENTEMDLSGLLGQYFSTR